MMDIDKYERPALQFSGGKDSLACLYLLRDKLDKLTVYHLDTGDCIPETVAVVEEVRAWVPNFVVIQSSVAKWRQEYGYPSDLMPAKAHWLGVAYGMNKFRLSNRFDCCWSNLMAPMHQQMIDDGVDLVIRGTKQCDTGTIPHEGKDDFYEVALPIKNWTHEEVFEYLHSVGAPQNAVYEYYKNISAPECLGCTAWWDDNKAAYLKARHPEKLQEYRANLFAIAGTLQSHLADLYTELKE